MAVPLAVAAKAAASKAGKVIVKKVGKEAVHRTAGSVQDRLGSNRKMLTMGALLGAAPTILVILVLVASVVSLSAVVGSMRQPSEEGEARIGNGMFEVYAETVETVDVPWELVAATALVLTDQGASSPYPEDDDRQLAQLLPVVHPAISANGGDSWEAGGSGVFLWRDDAPGAPGNPQHTLDSMRAWAGALDARADQVAAAIGLDREAVNRGGLDAPFDVFWTEVLDSLITTREACEDSDDTDDKLLVVLSDCLPPVLVDPDGPAIYETQTVTTTTTADGSDTDGGAAPQTTTSTTATTATGADSDSDAEAETVEVCVAGCAEPVLQDPPPPTPVGSEIVTTARWLTGDGQLLGGFVEGAFVGMDPTAASAYRNAVLVAAAEYPACDLDVYFLAGIGRVESNHGSHGGATIAANGDVAPPIRNPHSTAAGPMQILDGTWGDIAFDGNADGAADRDNYFDAAAAAARYLCRYLPEAMDARTDAGQRAMLAWYNSTPGYYEDVLGFTNEMKAADMAAGMGGPVGAPTGFGTNPLALTKRCGPRSPVSGGIVIGCPRSITFALVDVPTADGGTVTVAASIAPYVSAMMQAAAAQNIPLGGGGFRDAEGQLAVRRNNCGTSDYAVYQMPAGQCSPPTARPGTSMHELGEAIDTTCNGVITRYGTICHNWLRANAARYGFYQLPSESWHFSTTGS